MPYSYDVDRDARIAYVRAWGSLDIDETLKAPVRLSSHPDYEREFGVVVDLRDVVYHPRAQDVVDVVRNLFDLRRHFEYRIAIVVNDKLALAGELGAAMAQAGGFPLRIFSALDDAFDWVRPTRPGNPPPP